MNRVRFTGRLTRGPAIRLLDVLLLGVACGRRVPEAHLQPIDPACLSLLPSSLMHADSLLVYGDPTDALAAYQALRSDHPDCALLDTRVGDARRSVDRGDGADAYEDALAIEPCNLAALLGEALVRLPLSLGTEGRLREIATQLEEGAICRDAGTLASAEWRVRLLSGDVTGAQSSLERLGGAGLYPPALFELGRNLLGEVAPDGLLVTGSDIETDVVLLARGDVNSPGGPLVLDLHLLENPAYVEALRQAGLPLDMSKAEVARLAPFWSSERGRRVTVREQILRSLLAALGSRPLHITQRASGPALLGLRNYTTLVGLTLRVDESGGGIDLDGVQAALSGLELEELGSVRSLPTLDGWAYGAAEGHRLLSTYVASGFEGSVAAFQAGREDVGRGLLQFTHDRVNEIGASATVQAQIRELDALATP